jgi:cold shock protein
VNNGTIRKIVSDRGFGFITGEDGKDYFFHRDSLVAPLEFDRLAGGEIVTFEVEASPKGPRATKVTSA